MRKRSLSGISIAYVLCTAGGHRARKRDKRVQVMQESRRGDDMVVRMRSILNPEP